MPVESISLNIWICPLHLGGPTTCHVLKHSSMKVISISGVRGICLHSPFVQLDLARRASENVHVHIDGGNLEFTPVTRQISVIAYLVRTLGSMTREVSSSIESAVIECYPVAVWLFVAGCSCPSMYVRKKADFWTLSNGDNVHEISFFAQQRSRHACSFSKDLKRR